MPAKIQRHMRYDGTERVHRERPIQSTYGKHNHTRTRTKRRRMPGFHEPRRKQNCQKKRNLVLIWNDGIAFGLLSLQESYLYLQSKT